MTEEPTSVLYATSAKIGGIGLDSVAHETLRGIQAELGLALAYGNRASDLDPRKIKTLRWHPVKLLSNLERRFYYDAKKKAIDYAARSFLRKGRFDLFHSWAGDALHSLRFTKQSGIPSVLEIPTWHKHQGKSVPPQLEEELEFAKAPIPKRWLNHLLVLREHVLEEYELADLLLVLSEKAEETFLLAGVPKKKLFRTSRGVDVERFRPATKPSGIFRALFVGALVKRKGVHVLLEAWRALKLPRSELVLVGQVHPEIEPYLQGMPDSVKVAGFQKRVEEVYREASVFVFPSSLEGSAKSTYEAAASGLAQITTRESGDVVLDGVNGILVPPEDVNALSAAILRLYENPGLVTEMGMTGRQRVVDHFTWDHFRERVHAAYRAALRTK
jgi:glycosyltransferase involved in cell wall biosynthesis